MVSRKPTRQRRTSQPDDPVTAYAEDVRDGRIVAGQHVRNACRRHLLDLTEGPKRGLTWDVAAACRAINFFPDVLRLNGGQFEGVPFDLHPSQAFRVGSLFGWKRPDGTRRFRRFYDEEGKGNGKALALDTPIPTPSGWTTMADLKIGDRVFDERGLVCGVMAVTPTMESRPCYRVRFSDGAEIIADADHLWVTSALRTNLPKGPKPAGAPRKGKPAIRTTRQIAETLTVRLSGSKHPQAKWNHRVDVAQALDLPEAPLPVPPYTLGAWLGDGNSDDARLTVAYADWEIVEQIRLEGVCAEERGKHSETTARVILGSNGRAEAARGNSLQTRLRALGILGNKRIPALYLRASRLQRLALLQGLMDTDGYASRAGQCELTLMSGKLADDAMELIRSLGMKPTRRISDATLNGRAVGLRHRIQFWGSNSVPLFRLPRKQERLKEAPATRRISAGRMIVGCDPIPSVPVKCISVDSPSRMYLAGHEMIPTHNSPILAGIGLYCMLADGEARAEVYAAGSKKDQAMVLFRDAVAMVDQSPALRARLTKSGGNPVWNLADLKTGSFFRPISSDEGQSGPRPSCALCDEVHEHRDGRMVELLERGFKWRRQPLLIMATNSGSDRNSVCWQEHQHAVKVAAGDAIDDETFAFVCSLDEGDDPLEDPSCWVKANPLLGITVKEDYLAGVVRQAKSIPGKLNGILRLHFCVWTDAEQAWMSRSALENVLAEFDPAEHVGAKVYIGADLSGSQDLTALAFVVETGRTEVPRDGGGTASLPTFDAWIEAWTPRDTMEERALRDQSPYDVWAEQGWLNAESGKNIRLDFVAARIAEVASDYVVELLAYDRYVYAKLANELDALGVTVAQAEHPQGGKRRAKESGLWMPGSLLMLENLILERRIRLLKNPVLVSALMGATTEHDPFDNRWFSKRRATTRIDPAVALAMAIGAATAGIETESVYEKRPLLVF